MEKISDEIHKLREDEKFNGNFHEDEPQGTTSNKTYLCYQNSLSDDYELVDDDDDEPNAEKPTGEWSEIPLNSGPSTESNSTTSSYSHNSDPQDVDTETVMVADESKDDDKKNASGFSDWISKSSFRRQSLEDVFAQSTLFSKFGRMERRNSEPDFESSSSSTAKKEFFLFGRMNEGLTDSQIDCLFLPPEHL